jgi:peptidoglycan-associated lipoprotein
MFNLFKVSLLGLMVCALAFGMLGCKKKGTAGEGAPEGLEIEQMYNVPITEEEWVKAAGSEVAGIYQNIYFDFDKSDIKPEFRPILEAVADDLKANRGRFVRAVGHCDERGTNEYNFGLGERRAESVKSYLVALGVEAERVRTLSKGEEEPADPGHDEAAWAKNRRVEFFTVDK